MTSCLYLVLAACAAGGPMDSGCPNCGQAVPRVTDAVPVYSTTTEGRPGLLRRLFGARTQPTYYSEYVIESAAEPVVTAVPAGPGARMSTSPYHAEPPAAEVAGNEATLGGAEEAAEPQPAATAPPLTVAAKYQDRIGHEDDYSWITGHLFYVRADGGRWVLRYTLPDQVDKFGGSVVLAPGVEMKNFREGDLVCVTGRVLDESRTSPSLGGALYRVDTINIVERSDP
jgi:hypothetical protein